MTMIYISDILHILHGETYLSNTTITIVLILLIVAIILGIICFLLHKKNLSLVNKIREINSKTEDSPREILINEVATDYLKILSDTALLESFIPEEDRKLGLKILKKLYDVVYGKKSYPWEKAYKAISILYDNLPEKLLQLYPELDESEIRICCLTYMEINNTDIATIMHFKINTVQSKKSVIRKKLGIDGYGNIRDFIVEDLNKLK